MIITFRLQLSQFRTKLRPLEFLRREVVDNTFENMSERGDYDFVGVFIGKLFGFMEKCFNEGEIEREEGAESEGVGELEVGDGEDDCVDVLLEEREDGG